MPQLMPFDRSVTVPLPLPDFVSVSRAFVTTAASGAQAENSDVPLTACVAVALITPVIDADAKLAVPLALPDASVVTLTDPK